VVLPLGRLPRYLVLDPVSTVRLEVALRRPSCEIDVELENPKPGRSFLLVIGPVGGPVLQRMRLSGRARIVFEPQDDRSHVLMLANPQKEPLVLRLRGKALRPAAASGVRKKKRAGAGPSAARRPAARSSAKAPPLSRTGG
jgi:hypothetical protein